MQGRQDIPSPSYLAKTRRKPSNEPLNGLLEVVSLM